MSIPNKRPASIQVKLLKSRVRYKELYLSDSRALNIPVSSCIDENCLVRDDSSGLFAKCSNGEVKIFPTYCVRDQVTIGGFSIDLLIKEITDDQEYKSYETLAKYHYKGRSLFGRTSILIAVSTTPYLPRVIGYIELTTPFYVNKRRTEVLDAPFRHNGISWKSWDKATAKKRINTIVRIARCVVYPEFRGIGLGGKLIAHAEAFAKARWQIGKVKPLFLEISADMLRYIPFTEKAGMHYIGETEGNLNRIAQDLSYLLRNHKRVKDKEIVSNHQMGIVEQQKSRLRKALKLAKESNLSVAKFIERLEKLKQSKSLKDLTFFNSLLSFPKPTYLKGLDSISEEFVSRRVSIVSPKVEPLTNRLKVAKNNGPIELEGLSVTYLSKVRRTKKTQAIQNAFSISPSDIQSKVIDNVSVKIEPGEIVLVTGSSGSGKTTLLNFIANRLKGQKVLVSGKAIFPDNYKPGEFKGIRSRRALVEYFGEQDVSYALQLMGSVGLSDAFVFVKRFDELSKGQQYRALLAKLIHSKKNTLVVDEFCSNLDPITANVLAHKYRRLVKSLGITLIVGAAHCDNFINSLVPDKVIRLSTAWDYEVNTGAQYLKQYKPKYHSLNLQTLRFKSDFLDLIMQGKKVSTVRKASAGLKLGFCLFESGERVLPAYVKEIKSKRLSDLTERDAKLDGFGSRIELVKVLRKIYSGLKKNTLVSILYFDLVDFN